MRRAATVLVLAFLAFPGCSAQKQTQIIIGVSTDIPSTRFDEVFLGIGYIQPKQRVTEVTWRLGPEIQLPARFALVPGSDARRVVDITVEARKSGKTLVGRQARLSFVRDRVIFLSMNLIARCVGVKCGEDQTCGEIGCETVDKNGEKLPDYSPDLETSLADAGAADAFPADLAGGGAHARVRPRPLRQRAPPPRPSRSSSPAWT